MGRIASSRPGPVARCIACLIACWLCMGAAAAGTALLSWPF